MKDYDMRRALAWIRAMPYGDVIDFSEVIDEYCLDSERVLSNNHKLTLVKRIEMNKAIKEHVMGATFSYSDQEHGLDKFELAAVKDSKPYLDSFTAGCLTYGVPPEGSEYPSDESVEGIMVREGVLLKDMFAAYVSGSIHEISTDDSVRDSAVGIGMKSEKTLKNYCRQLSAVIQKYKRAVGIKEILDNSKAILLSQSISNQDDLDAFLSMSYTHIKGVLVVV